MHVLARTYAAVRDLQVVDGAGSSQTEKAGGRILAAPKIRVRFGSDKHGQTVP
jgi:hypothetical protein